MLVMDEMCRALRVWRADKLMQENYDRIFWMLMEIGQFFEM